MLFGLARLHKPYTTVDIASAKRCRGTVRVLLTRMEKDISKIEEKEELTPWNRKMRCMKELAKQFDCEFEETITEDLSNLDFEVRRLLLDLEDSHKHSEASSKVHVQLPKTSIPKS